MADILNAAKWYVEHGISVIPVKADGSKAPLLSGWRKYSDERPDDATLEGWFGGSQIVGVGVPCGPASGNLVVMDFECVGVDSAYVDWLTRLPDELRAFAEALPTSVTPSGGRHIWVRLAEPQTGGRLAQYANKKTKIEIRGHGHQVLVPGCPAECHKSGKLYEWKTPPAEDVPFPVVDDDVFAELVLYCVECNEYQPPEQPRDRSGSFGTPAGADSPGNDFNHKGTWEQTGLFDAGWTWSKQVGADRGFLTRPGKESGISASVGMVSSKESGYPYLYVWSTSTDFGHETPYSRFAVYAILKHAGNFSEAAKQLQREGYGGRYEQSDKGHGVEIDLSKFKSKFTGPNGEPIYPFANTSTTAPPKTEKGEEKPFKWMSELSAQAEDATWIWEGYLARTGITLLSALWKSGKSTLLSHLLKSLDGSQTHFLGQKVMPSRVLYITEEAENIWAKRRDNLLIGNHVGIACRPFKTRPTMPEWKTYLKLMVEQIQKHHFDLVVFDTLSKMWPVREENDAGQVEEALQPLWPLAEQNTAILLVHHTRKSGGNEFVAARGSGGLPAFCEILLEFGRCDAGTKTQRVIRGVGRYEAIPEQVLIELTPSGYVAHGNPDSAEVKVATRRFPWEPDLVNVLTDAGAWLAFEDIERELSALRNGETVRRNDILAVLKKRFEDGEIEREGEGRKGSPYRYRVPVCEA